MCLQVLRYDPGQFYRLQHDQNAHVDSAAGVRVYTFFLYLSNVTAGGSTRFPNLGIEVKPQVGRVVLWPSVRDDDVYADDLRTEHEALEVIEGVKYAANFWVHLRDFQTPHAAGCKGASAAATRRRTVEREGVAPSASQQWRAAPHGPASNKRD